MVFAFSDTALCPVKQAVFLIRSSPSSCQPLSADIIIANEMFIFLHMLKYAGCDMQSAQNDICPADRMRGLFMIYLLVLL